MNKALLLKLAWQILEGENPLFHVLKDRFTNKFGEVRSYGVVSSIWISIKSLFSGLLNETLWIIGEHSFIKFWTSNWLGFTIASRVDKKIKVNWNASISEFYANGSWNLPAVLQINYGEIVTQINQVKIQSGHIDKLVWKNNLLGKLTTRAAFETFSQQVPKLRWGKWIWEAFIPPRKSILFWRIMHNALPTLDCIRMRGIPWSVCSFCLHNSENVDHIFTNCSIAIKIWNHFSKIVHLNFDISAGFHNILNHLMSIDCSPTLKSINKVLFMSIISNIWESRNKLVFEGIRPYINGMITSIWNSIHDLKSFKLGGFHGTQEELQIANTFQLPFFTKKSMTVKEVFWAPPPPSWIKINVDGSAKGAHGEMISAGVFRTCRGFVKGCFVANMGIGLALEAEIWAVILALELAHNKGWRSIWIESDSLLVVELLKKRSKVVPWRILPRWLHRLHILNNMDIVISHIFREGNQTADHLTAISERSFRWWSHCPEFLWPFVCRDLQQRPFFQFS